MATMLTVPHTRTTSVTRRAAAGLPVTSNATSTPSPPVNVSTKRCTSMSGPEHEHAVAPLHPSAVHVVRGHRERLDHGRLIVVERIGHVEELRHRDRPVLLHAAAHVDAADLQLL